MFKHMSSGQDPTNGHVDSPSINKRVRDYVARYESLTESEVTDLVNAYCSLTPIEVALLRSEETLKGNLEQFRADYRSEIRVPFRQYASLVWIGLFGLIVSAFAILTGS